MIKNTEILQQFETEFIKNNRLSYSQSLKIFEAMWQEAVSLGILPTKDLLEGIEVNIRIAGILNQCLNK